MANQNNSERQPMNLGYVQVAVNMRLGAEPEFTKVGERGVVRVRGAVGHVNKTKEGSVQETNWYNGDFWCGVNEAGEPIGPAGALFRNYESGKWVTITGFLQPNHYNKKDGSEGLDLKVAVNGLSFDNMSFAVDGEGTVSEEKVVATRSTGRAANNSSSGRTAPAPAGRRTATTKTNAEDDMEWQ